MNVFLQTVASLVYAATGTNIEPDQLAYFVGLYTSLFGAYLVKNKLQRSTLSKTYQLYLIGFIGLWIYYTIWEWLVLLPIIQACLSFLMLVFLPPQKSTKCIFLFAMSFLSLCHLYVVYIHFNSVTITTAADFTGPLMIMTQRIIALAYSLQDGMTKTEKELDDYQKKYAVRKLPSFPEYFAYMFSFTGIMCGPFAFYNDVIPFLRGDDADNKKSNKTSTTPSETKVVFTKVACSMLFIYLYWVGTNSYPHRRNIDSNFIASSPLLYRIFYLYISLFLARAKYYGAWMFADAVHNVMGIGYNGQTKDGRARWDAVSNINVLKIEFATGLKTYIDNWNMMTVRWLRYVSYSRSPPSRRTITSFLLSAFWHGFFPGYYIMFLTCHTWLLMQRKAHRLIKPHFQSSLFLRSFYDVITCVLTQLGITYAALAFVVLEWSGSIRFYKSVWFSGHIIGFFLYFSLLFYSRVNSSKKQDNASNVRKENGFGNKSLSS